MLRWFPTPYPDELWYSVICRYFMYSGYTSKTAAVRDILPDGKPFVSVHYAVRLEEFRKNLPDNWLSTQEIIEKHTLYPYYSRFLPAERKKRAIDCMLGRKPGAPAVVLGDRNLGNKKEAPYWRYCPLCAKEDFEKYGETYWHRLPQILDLRVCPVHKVFLNKTSYPVLNGFELFAPVFSIEEASVQKISAQELEVAQLIKGLLESPCDMLYHSARQLFDRPLVEQQIRSPTGRNTDIVRLNDMLEKKLYGPIRTMGEAAPGHCTLKSIREMLKRNRAVSTINIVHVGWVLGLSLQDFLAFTKEEDLTENRWDRDVREMYAQGWTKEGIAKKYALSVDAVEDNLIRMGLYTPVPQKKAKFEEMKAARKERCRNEILEIVQQKDVTQQIVRDRTSPHFRSYTWMMKYDREWITQLISSLPVKKNVRNEARNWELLDIRTYPKVVEAVQSMEGQTMQITSICSKVGIRRMWLDKLPRCQQYIKEKVQEQKVGTNPEK